MKFTNIITIFSIICLISPTNAIKCEPKPGEPTLTPMGIPKGYKPGRVVWTHDPKSTFWDGNTNYWWKGKFTSFDRVDNMLKDTILKLTDEKDLKQAWDRLFVYFNKNKHQILKSINNFHSFYHLGYQPGQKITIKINLNGNTYGYEDNNASQISPQFLKSLLRMLVNVVGVKQEDITIYDATRNITPKFTEPPDGIFSEFPNVNLFDNKGGYSNPKRNKAMPDYNTRVFFSSNEVFQSNNSFIPTFVSTADYMISICNFRGHSLAGMTLSGKNWFGSIYRPEECSCYDKKGEIVSFGHWCPAGLHDTIEVDHREMGMYNPLVDLLGHPKLGRNVFLFLSDALYGGLTQNHDGPNGTLLVDIPIKYNSEPFNNHWTSSILASQDPIALDSVGYDILHAEKQVVFTEQGCTDNYLHEAALAPSSPSGTQYNPGMETESLNSLGVHEHRDNNMQYSKNIDKQNAGIELIYNSMDVKKKSVTKIIVLATTIPIGVLIIACFIYYYVKRRNVKESSIQQGLLSPQTQF